MNSVSFRGSVYLKGATAQTTTPYEQSELKKYADEFDCDIIVTNREVNDEKRSIFKTLKIQHNAHDKKNMVFDKFFSIEQPNSEPEKTWWI